MRIKIYEYHKWPRFFWTFHQTNIFKKLQPLVIFVVIYSTLVVYLEDNIAIFKKNMYVTHNLGWFHLLFNGILGIAISFRVKAAYDKWWEARGLWGTLTNNSRNLALKFEVMLGLKKHEQFFKLLQVFPMLLNHHLKKNYTRCYVLLNDLNISVPKGEHAPNIAIREMYEIISNCYRNNEISAREYDALDKHLSVFSDVVGGCEKIANTLMPEPFDIFINKSLIFYVLIFPFGWADDLGYFMVPVLVSVVYLLCGLEAISEEMEEPFGYEDNDLNTRGIANNIKKNVQDLAR